MMACAEHFERARRDDDGDDREDQEVDRQAEEIAGLHGRLVFSEPGEVAEVEQKRREK